MADRTYCHSRKAGNRGDVWKHYALARILGGEAVSGTDVYIETHAGGSVYELEEKWRRREWGRGIARVAQQTSLAKEPFQIILSQVNPTLTFPGLYPGSAFIASTLLRPSRHVLFERNEVFAQQLRRYLPQADVRAGDGYTGLLSWVRHESQLGDRLFAFMDPSYDGGREELLTDIPQRLTTLRGKLSHCSLAVWYPVYNTYLKLDELCELYRQASELPTWVVECMVDAPSRDLKGSGLLVLNLPNRELHDELVGLAYKLAHMMKDQDEQPDCSRHYFLR